MASRDCSSYSKRRTPAVCAGERGRRVAWRRRLRSCASSGGRPTRWPAVGVDHVLLLVPRRSDRARRRAHRDDRSGAPASAGHRAVAAAPRPGNHRRSAGGLAGGGRVGSGACRAADIAIRAPHRVYPATRLARIDAPKPAATRRSGGRSNRAIGPVGAYRADLHADLCGRWFGGLRAGRRAKSANGCAGDVGRSR